MRTGGWFRRGAPLALLVASGSLAGAQEPTLGIEPEGPDSLRLTRDVGALDWITEQSDDLLLFDTILQAPMVEAGQIVLTLDRPPGIPHQFFRLRPQKTSGVIGGLNFLRDSQMASGPWGSLEPLMLRDTSVSLEALLLVADFQATVDAGVLGLAAKEVNNNDDLARKIHALASAGASAETAALVDDLLAAENPTAGDPAFLGFPGGGWGLAAGLDNSTIDTALALRAVRAAGLPTALSVVNESAPASGSSPAHAFEVPAGATDLTLSVRALSANARFNLHPPGGGTSFVDLTPGSAPIDINFGNPTAGTWSLTVDDSSGGGTTFSAEVSFTTAEGIDVAGFTAAASYLGLVQNPDGGWGMTKDFDSHLMITCEVVFALAQYGDAFQAAIDAGASWLATTKQNGDGGFSSEADNSNVQETALAILAIRRATPGVDLSTALDFLRDAQLLNGSWSEDPYLTALATLAIAQPPVVSDIPNQTVTNPDPFAVINLDDFVDDRDHSDSELLWTASGNSLLSVSIVDRVATITHPGGSEISETITFTATDPDGLAASDDATFTVTLAPLVDFTIARNGFVTGSRDITGDSAVLDQVASFNIPAFSPPPDVSYSTTGITRPSPTAFTVGFRIDVGPTAPLGVHDFTVIYIPVDGSNQPVGPISGNAFDFTIEITP